MDIAEIVQEMNRRFALPLKEYCERHIIFWHDPDGEFAEEIDTLSLDNAKVLKLTGKNQFLTKSMSTRKKSTTTPTSGRKSTSMTA